MVAIWLSIGHPVSDLRNFPHWLQNHYDTGVVHMRDLPPKNLRGPNATREIAVEAPI